MDVVLYQISILLLLLLSPNLTQYLVDFKVWFACLNLYVHRHILRKVPLLHIHMSLTKGVSCSSKRCLWECVSSRDVTCHACDTSLGLINMSNIDVIVHIIREDVHRLLCQVIVNGQICVSRLTVQ